MTANSQSKDTTKRLEKEIQYLKKKLERSEKNRAALENAKDKNQQILKKVNEEIEEARQTIERQNNALLILYQELEIEKQKSDELLLNILPEKVAEELKNTGTVQPVRFDSVSILFTDFKGFTQITEKMSIYDLVNELHICFSHFDKIISQHKLEKIKTIGDSYMCTGGIPDKNKTHAVDTVLAAIKFLDYIERRKEQKLKENQPYWEIRIGINSGQILAGVVGFKKFAYDIWGDTVNLASRMESSGEPGKINISESTYELIKDIFNCTYRGKIKAKNKGEVNMYFVEEIKPELTLENNKIMPNEQFNRMYESLR